jgi:hypothetical protein
MSGSGRTSTPPSPRVCPAGISLRGGIYLSAGFAGFWLGSVLSKPAVPEDLTPAEKRQLMKWVRANAPEWFTPKRLKWLVGETLDY